MPTPPSDCCWHLGGSHTSAQFKRQLMYGSGTPTARHVNLKSLPCGTTKFDCGGSTTVGCTQPAMQCNDEWHSFTPRPNYQFHRFHLGNRWSHRIGSFVAHIDAHPRNGTPSVGTNHRAVAVCNSTHPTRRHNHRHHRKATFSGRICCFGIGIRSAHNAVSVDNSVVKAKGELDLFRLA